MPVTGWRHTLEQLQILVYLAAIGCGLIAGTVWPRGLGLLEAAIWPLLALLLYTTFMQVPLGRLREALADLRFMQAALIGNFLILPLLVFGLSRLLPDDPALRIGVLLVLLVPCTDWFISFSHLGGGDARCALTFAPVSLLLQILLLPFYLWLFLGESFAVTMFRREILLAFAGLIVLPLLAAALTEKLVRHSSRMRDLPDLLAWCPVPLLTLVVFAVAASQVNLIMASLSLLLHLLVIFASFLLAAGLLARGLARFWKLPVGQGRVLAFSLGTRNSLVVLPLALALPDSYELAAVAIVFQSLIELIGMVIFLWWVPRKLFPDPALAGALYSERERSK